MTLYQIWDLVSYIAGKFPSGGAIPPARFNIVLPEVQDEWTARLMDEVVAASVNPDVLNKVLSTTPLIPFKKSALLTAGSNGQSTLPSDYNRYYSVETLYARSNNSGGRRSRKIDVISDDLFAAKRGSVFTRADVMPFAKIDSYGIWVVPFDTEDFTLDYFRKPAMPFFDWCQDSDNPNRIVYMPTGSTIVESQVQGKMNLTLENAILHSNVIKDGVTIGNPDPLYVSKTVELEYDAQHHFKFVYMILEKCGINLSEDMVTKYAMERNK